MDACKGRSGGRYLERRREYDGGVGRVVVEVL